MAAQVSRLEPGVWARARVPASSANLGPGFDSIGIALGVWDSCLATVTAEPGLRITVAGEGAKTVPRDESHLVYRTMARTWAELGVEPPSGLTLECRNEVPHGRGLGSSATAIVTGILTAAALAEACGGAALERSAANDLANRLEGHPDNASASLYGGFTVSWSDDLGAVGATRTVRPRLHPDLDVVVFVPEAQLSTAKARSVLPSSVLLADAASNTGRAALLVHAMTADPSLLLPATRDWLHQEPRRGSYAASMRLVDRLRSAGHAAVISGAGPSVLVLTTAERIADIEGLISDGWRMLRPGVPTEGAHVGTGIGDPQGGHQATGDR